MRTFDGPGDENYGIDFSDNAEGVAVDSDGNVFVSGTTNDGSEALSDITTLKYDPFGSLLWAKSYDGPGAEIIDDKDIKSMFHQDYFGALTIDRQNNVYIAGTGYMGKETGNDGVLIKYAR